MDWYDTLIGEHSSDVRCPYVHGYTVETTTCPVILDLVRMQADALSRQGVHRYGRPEGE